MGNNKLLIWILILVTLSFSVNGGVLTQTLMTNGLNSENFFYNETLNLTRYITIPRYINIETGKFLLEGIGGNFSCYQEYANITPKCGGITKGVYYKRNSWSIVSYLSTHDGDWDTSGINSLARGDVNITYFKPKYAKNTSYIKIKLGDQKVYNLTINHSCWSYSSSKLLIQMTSLNAPLSSSLKCRNISGYVNMIIVLGDKRVYENAIIWNLTSNLTDPYLEVGDVDGTREWEYKGDFLSTQQANFTAKIDYILNNSCTCTNCTLSSNMCTIPFFFNTNNSGILNISSIIINYTTKNTPLIITFKDAETFDIINTTNLTLDVIWSLNSTKNTTITGIVGIIFPIQTANDVEELTFRAHQTIGTDYSITRRIINVTQGIGQNITIYMFNTSDTTTSKLVTIHVQDESRNNLENAILHILLQNPSTGVDISLQDIATDANGEAQVNLKLNNFFYKFLVDFDGSRFYTSKNYVSITTNTDDIYLIGTLEPKFTQFYETMFETNVGLSFNEVTNASGNFVTTFSGSRIIETCMYVYLVNGTNNLVDKDCANSTTGTLTSSVFSPANTTLYTAKVLIDYKDGDGFRFIKSLSEYIGLLSNNQFGNDGSENILLLILPIPIAAFGFIATPVAGFILLGIAYMIVFLTKLTFLKISALMIIETFVVIGIITITRIKRQ